jgi:hypothetical protein
MQSQDRRRSISVVLSRPGWLCSVASECPSISAAARLAVWMVAQSLRRSKRQAIPSAASGSAITHSHCSPAVNAGCSFQCIIGEIMGHEGFVNFVEIAGVILHGILQRFEPLLIRVYHMQAFDDVIAMV